MSKIFLLAATLLLVSAARAQAPAASLDAQALAAYEAKDYSRSGQLFDQALQAKKVLTASDYYNAACAWALAGSSDKAFAYLDKATLAGWDNVAHVQTDTDLTSLHPDQRWQPTLAKLEATVAKREATVNQALKKELAGIYRTDQRIRLKIDSVENKDGIQAAMAPALVEEMRTADERNLARVEAIIKQYGWPGNSLAGKAGITTAFLVIQHSDAITQRKYLPLLREAAAKGELAKSSLALLEDRVLMGQGKPQLYGSQLRLNQATQKYELYTIADEAHVDERRAAVGLQPLAEYVKYWNLEYTPKK